MHDTLKKIMDLAGAKDPSGIAHELIHDDHPFFYDYYRTPFQYGGDKKYSILFEGYNFVVIQIDESDRRTYYVRDDAENNCIVMAVPSPNTNKYKLANINNISYFSTCAKTNSSSVKSGLQYPGGGSNLLKFAIYFLTKNKDKLGINKITLMDNSRKNCKNGNIIDMSLIHILLFGKTWYSKYGFRPYSADDNTEDSVFAKKLDKYDSKIKRKLVKDIPNLKQYITDAFDLINSKNISTKMIIHLIDIMQDKKLNYFLQVLLSDYDLNCELFYHIYKKIANDLHIEKTYGSTYYLNI
jgi:hypothetical protein